MKSENLLIILRVAVPEAVVACSRKTPCAERIGLFVPLVTGREPEGGEGGEVVGRSGGEASAGGFLPVFAKVFFRLHIIKKAKWSYI